ncbi:MAG TPA: protein kinase [Polyangia bacterium]
MTGPRYELLRELGRGGMGVAYLALAKGPQGFSKLVVLKRMRPSLVGIPESHRQFLEEARISARLAHPNVVQVHEVCDYDGTPAMVMEYLEGKPLSTILWEDGLPAPRALLIYILAKALAGLHAAHDLRDYDGTPLNLVHRDASPHNIFVTFDGQIKVLDFGIAKAEGSEVETRAGATKGKLRYMSPEQFLQLPVDRRVDVFAVGVTLWEILAGRRFWDRASDDDVAADLIAKKLPSLPPNTNVPADLAAICARAIAPDSDQRYATAGRLQRDIEDHLSRQPDRVSGEDVAVFMHYRFDVEQDSARHFVQSHVRSAQQAAVDGGLDPTLVLTGKVPPPDGVGAGIGGAGGGGSASGARGVSSTAPMTPAAPRRSKVRALVLAVTGIVFLAVAVLAGVMRAGAGGTSPRGPSARAAAGEGAAAAACEPEFKRCEGSCVSIDRPDRGCGAEACHACTVPNATPRCNRSRACDIAVCYQGFQDCNGDSGDGCETSVRTDPDNCGACGRKCPPLAHAERGCGDVCTIWRCAPGHRDCNGVVADGCEVSTADDAANCGACGHACAARQVCRNGTCR